MAKLVTWSQYRESIGDRSGLFSALADAWPIERALYPGSYVDLRLEAAVHHHEGRYQVTTDRLDRYLIPKRPERADLEMIRASGRGIAYTHPAFAYLFQRL
jgi:hypothetical protein